MNAHPVGIIKDLCDALGLAGLRIAHHGVRADHFDIRELGIKAQRRSQGGLAAPQRTLQQTGQQRRLLATPYLHIHSDR